MFLDAQFSHGLLLIPRIGGADTTPIPARNQPGNFAFPKNIALRVECFNRRFAARQGQKARQCRHAPNSFVHLAPPDNRLRSLCQRNLLIKLSYSQVYIVLQIILYAPWNLYNARRAMANSIYDILGRRVRNERHAASLTLEDLAARAQISPSYLSYIESGRRKASLATVDKLARALRLGPADLLGPQESAADPAAQTARRFLRLVQDCDVRETRVIFDVARSALRAMRRG